MVSIMVYAFMIFMGFAGLFVALALLREQRQARRACVAEQAQLDAYVPPTPQELEDLEERRRAREWVVGFDAYIADWQARWDTLWAGEPTGGDDPFDPAYWPTPEQGPTSVPTIATLADFEPAAALHLITAANAAPAWFSWTTDSLPVVTPREVPARLTVGAWRRVREPALAIAA